MSTAATPIAGTFQPLPVAGTFQPLKQQGTAQPMPVSNPAAAPTQQQPAGGGGLTDNPAGEGIYGMTDPTGTALKIPYSKVDQAHRQGYRFADEGNRSRYMQDFDADPVHESRVDAYLKDAPWWYRAAVAPSQINAGLFAGAGAGLERTVAGADRLVRSATGGRLSAPEESLQDAAARPTHGMSQAAGEAGEGIGEFLTGGELLSLAGKGAAAGGEVLGLGEKMKTAQQLAATFERNPMVAKLVKIGMSAVRNGTIAGGQTLVKTGGDTDAAGGAGLLTAGASAATEGALSGASSYLAKRATTLEDVGGVKMPVSAEVRNTASTPVQRAGQEAIQSSARSAVRPHLEEVNATRTAPATAPQLDSSTGPFEFTLRGARPAEDTEGQIAHSAAKAPGRHSFEPPQYTTASAPNRSPLGSEGSTGGDISTARPPEAAHDVASGAGTFKTQDPNIVKAHIAHLNEIIDGPHFDGFTGSAQKNLLDARSEAQQQLAKYHGQVSRNLQHVVYGNEPSSVLKPVDIPATLRKVGSYTDAADHLERTATEGYTALNDLTGDKFNAIRQENRDAWNAYKGASGEEAQEGARKAVDESNRKMESLLSGLRGVADDRMLDGFNDAYRNAQNLRKVAQAVDSTFVGNASTSARSWEYRGFSGDKLMTNLSKLQQQMGRPTLERLVGKDNVDTLFRVAELNRTGAQRQRFGSAVSTIAKHMPMAASHVSAAGAGAYVGYKTTHDFMGTAVGLAAGSALGSANSAVMRAILTNPKVAQNLIFALDSGARPDHYAPFIAELIQKASTDSSRESQADASGDQ